MYAEWTHYKHTHTVHFDCSYFSTLSKFGKDGHCRGVWIWTYMVLSISAPTFPRDEELAGCPEQYKM